MNKSIFKFQLSSAIFIAILGTFLHFTYNLSGGNVIVGLFSAVNESTWEHLKLIFFPNLITIIIGYFYIGKNIPNFLCAKTLGLITSILFTIIFFYTYTGILGYNIAFINILTFYTAVILGEYTAYRIMLSNFKCNKKIAIIILSVLFACFVIFTFNTPQIGLFEDPVNGGYGINSKKY